jgi:UDP-N-acetylmuramate dehydrogenase
MSSPIAVAAAVLGDRAEHDVPLAPMTTYRVGGPAALFVRARSIGDVVAVGRAHRASGLPVLVIGRGSNLLVADAGYEGIAVSIAELAADVVLDGGDGGAVDLGAVGVVRGDAGEPKVVTAGGGAALPVVARRTAAAGLRGFEWAVGVPGTIGGGVRMNAGGHGSDMAACVTAALVVDLGEAGTEAASDGEGAAQWWPVAELDLGFRRSGLGDLHVVMAAQLALRVGARDEAEAEIAEIVRWRREHQPGGQNAGSVFVNPVPGEVSAGALIDQLGLRGTRIGTAWVSEKHANFIQAAEGGRADDVRAVIELVRARVAAATGYHLRSEVRLVGFDDVVERARG